MLSILVVLYNKELEDSKTLSFLKKHKYKKKEKINLVIVNNGPLMISDDCSTVNELSKEFNVELIHKLHNEPLSSLYNWFIENYKNHYYSILDDDSSINQEIYNNFIDCESKPDLSLPIIEVKNRGVFYPYVNGNVYKYENKILSPKDVIKTITSGIIFSDRLCIKIKDYYSNIFDTSYVLYGVDSSFCARINRLKDNNFEVKISTNKKLIHELSRVDSKQSKSNRRERIIDMGISYRKYPESITFKEVFKANIKLLLLGYIGLVKDCIKAYYSASHPRSKRD